MEAVKNLRWFQLDCAGQAPMNWAGTEGGWLLKLQLQTWGWRGWFFGCSFLASAYRQLLSVAECWGNCEEASLDLLR